MKINKIRPKFHSFLLFLFCFVVFAVLYFSTSLIVLNQVYNWEIRHHSLICCCGFASLPRSRFLDVTHKTAARETMVLLTF